MAAAAEEFYIRMPRATAACEAMALQHSTSHAHSISRTGVRGSRASLRAPRSGAASCCASAAAALCGVVVSCLSRALLGLLQALCLARLLCLACLSGCAVPCLASAVLCGLMPCFRCAAAVMDPCLTLCHGPMSHSLCVRYACACTHTHTHKQESRAMGSKLCQGKHFAFVRVKHGVAAGVVFG